MFLVNTLILQVNRGSSLVASQGRGTSAPLYGIGPPARAPHLETWLHSQKVRDGTSTVPPPQGKALLIDPSQSWVPYIERNTLLSPKAVKVRDNIYNIQPNTHHMGMGTVVSQACSSSHTHRQLLDSTALPYRVTSSTIMPSDSEHPPEIWDSAGCVFVSVLIGLPH